MTRQVEKLLSILLQNNGFQEAAFNFYSDKSKGTKILICPSAINYIIVLKLQK